jgi:hypothetical protein
MSHELAISINNLSFSALNTALIASSSKFQGLTVVQNGGAVVSARITVDDSAIAADETAMLGAVSAHDPVFLSVDKATITADGVDAATITVSAPKQGAAAVTLLVNGSPVPVTLTAGIGTIQISSADPATITVSAQTPANRTTDTLSIKAV